MEMRSEASTLAAGRLKFKLEYKYVYLTIVLPGCVLAFFSVIAFYSPLNTSRGGWRETDFKLGAGNWALAFHSAVTKYVNSHIFQFIRKSAQKRHQMPGLPV